MFSYVFQYKKQIAIALCAMIVNAGASSLIAILVGQLTDKGFYEKDPNAIWWAPGALLAISLAYGVASFVSAYYLQSISQSVLFSFRQALFLECCDGLQTCINAVIRGRVIDISESGGGCFG